MATKNIQSKLLMIQKDLKAPKGQYNSFGKYHYRSAEDILEAVKPLCGREDVVLTLSDSLINMGDRFYIQATATVTSGEESISVTAYAREEETKKGMDGSQITGTASSYARKYALNGLFLIDDTKDADTDAFKKQQDLAEEEQKAAEEMEKQISAKEAKDLKAFIETKGADEKVICDFYKVADVSALTKSQYGQVVRRLMSK